MTCSVIIIVGIYFRLFLHCHNVCNYSQEKYEGALDAVQGSLLHQMFSPNFIEKVPKDKEVFLVFSFVFRRSHFFRKIFLTEAAAVSMTYEKVQKGRFILDFNPTCFGILIDWVKNKKISHSGALRVSPCSHSLSNIRC